MRVRVKYCGITRLEDAQFAAEQGVDALGFVFFEESPRYVSPQIASAIIKRIPSMVTTVGLFVNTRSSEVRRIADQTGIDMIQYHGDEHPTDCSEVSRRWIKAIRVRREEDIVNAEKKYHDASALLLDSWKPGAYGGTGECFDWRKIPRHISRPFILAGGLDPSNIRRAIRETKPFAVDVSGGIELDKGIKDPDKMRAFIEEIENLKEDDKSKKT